jgi:hypothetical protein
LPGAGVLLGRHQGDSAEKEEKSEGLGRHRCSLMLGKTVWKERVLYATFQKIKNKKN